MSHIIQQLKRPFTALPIIHDLQGYKKLNGRDGYRIRVTDYRPRLLGKRPKPRIITL